MEYNKIFTQESIVYFCEIDKIQKTEIWKDVKGYEGLYQVSDLGRIKSLSVGKIRKGKIIKLNLPKRHYLVFNASKNGKQKLKKVHQAVAEAFLNHTPCGMELVVNHKNYIKTDNRAINLEIISNRANCHKKHLNVTSKYVGVCFVTQNQKYVAQIQIKGIRKHLGFFNREKDAHKAYQNALRQITNPQLSLF